MPLFFLYCRLWLGRAAWVLGALLVAHSGARATLVIPTETQSVVVKVGVYANAPKIFLDSQGKISGILGDVLNAVAENENWTIAPVSCEWQACLQALREGSIDLMPDVAYTEQRATEFDFHATPALLSWSQIYRRKGVPLHSMLDLKDKRIAVVKGSVQVQFLQNLLQSFGVSATLVDVDSFEQGFERVSDAELDAVATNRFFGDMQAGRYGLEPSAIIFQPAQLFYAAAKGQNAKLLTVIEGHLADWKLQTNSPYAVAMERWLHQAPKSLLTGHWRWALPTLLGLLLLALLINAWLRRQVARQTAALKSSQERLAIILDSVDAYIYIKDPQLRYQYANGKVCELFGLTLAEVLGKTDEVFFDADTVTKLRVNDLRVIERGERVEEDEVNRSADGTVQRSFVSVKLPLRDALGHIYALCGISTDITKRKQSEETIHQLAFFDDLTGLPNRRLLHDRVQQHLHAMTRSPQGAALMFIDVDNFKDINDTLGHGVGDVLLCQMAQRMGECIRAQDTLARQGGDEFVVMLVDLSSKPQEAARQAEQVAQKIRLRVSEAFVLDSKPYQSGVSIGVVLVDPRQDSCEDLFKKADLAMYKAKADGRNAVRFFDPAMQAQVMARTTLEADLHGALSAHEFLLHYQPQVNADGSLLGYEALVRWQHPVHGMVAPGNFIAAAEACAVILPLGAWIMQTACEQLVRWAGQTPQGQYSIAVNVSAKQFRQVDFVAQVKGILQHTGANPQRLELELTESQLVDDVAGVIEKMQALRELGVRLSLDDFGTGYSSLAMLKRLPLHQLKIDQGFVRDMLTDPQDASIIRAIVSMGESMHLDVIAEGVEQLEQRDVLLQLGCRHFQGYLFGRPAPL